MRFVTMKNIEPGVRTGKPITNSKGLILVNTNHLISQKAIELAKDSGAQGFYINDDTSKDIYVNEILTEETRGLLMSDLQHRDFVALQNGAKTIIDNVRHIDLKTVSLIEYKNLDSYTLKHSIATAIFAVVIGKQHGLDEEQLKNLCLAALLMDIGKLDMIDKEEDGKLFHSNKVFRADGNEMNTIKLHAKRSYEILQDNINVGSLVRNAVLLSHENLDGSGYYGFKSEQIHILPRILRVAEIYDAMTSTRRHRAAFSPAEAIEYIMSEASAGRLDMNVCQTFRNTFPAYGVGFTVKLDNGEQAVVKSLEESTTRPLLISLKTGTSINLNKELNRTIIGIV